MIKVYIISGFLGSGKTTLIKKLLEDNIFHKLMLIENEFGDIGIDGNLFDNNLKVKEINSGCICCSLKGDLLNALEEIKTYDIENLIIEPSGVGKLSEVMSAIVSDKHFELASHICMVDASKAILYHKNFKEFFDDQVNNANSIILSKLDKIDDNKLSEIKEMLKSLNDDATILDKPYLEIESQKLFQIITNNICECEECICSEACHHHYHHHADEVFNSFSINTDKQFSYDSLYKILNDIKNDVIRAKGIVKSDDLYLYFDISGDDINISRKDAKKFGIITIISDQNDIAKIKELFI